MSWMALWIGITWIKEGWSEFSCPAGASPKILQSWELKATLWDDWTTAHATHAEIVRQVMQYNATSEPYGFSLYKERGLIIPASQTNLILYENAVTGPDSGTYLTAADQVWSAEGYNTWIRPSVNFTTDPTTLEVAQIGDKYGSNAANEIIDRFLNFPWGVGTGPFIHILFTDGAPWVRGQSQGSEFDTQPVNWVNPQTSTSSYIELNIAGDYLKTSSSYGESYYVVVFVQATPDARNPVLAWSQLLNDMGLSQYSITEYLPIESSSLVQETILDAIFRIICAHAGGESLHTTTTAAPMTTMASMPGVTSGTTGVSTTDSMSGASTSTPITNTKSTTLQTTLSPSTLTSSTLSTSHESTRFIGAIIEGEAGGTKALVMAGALTGLGALFALGLAQLQQAPGVVMVGDEPIELLNEEYVQVGPTGGGVIRVRDY